MASQTGRTRQLGASSSHNDNSAARAIQTQCWCGVCSVLQVWSKRVRVPRFELGISQPQCEVLTTILHTPGEAGYRSQYLSHAKRALYHSSYIPILAPQTPTKSNTHFTPQPHQTTTTAQHAPTRTTHTRLPAKSQLPAPKPTPMRRQRSRRTQSTSSQPL